MLVLLLKGIEAMQCFVPLRLQGICNQPVLGIAAEKAAAPELCVSAPLFLLPATQSFRML